MNSPGAASSDSAAPQGGDQIALHDGWSGRRLSSMGARGDADYLPSF
jgi:hypothetical protein